MVNNLYAYGHFTSSRPNDGSDGSCTNPSGEAPSQGRDGLTTRQQQHT